MTHVHLGGDFTRKGDVVDSGRARGLAAAGRREPGHAADRMDLARWLVDRRNPLTARVTVNRIWQAVLRPRPGRDRQRLRHPGLAPEPSRAARLAGLRVHGARLEPQGNPPADRDLGDLPPVVAGPARGTGDRSRQPAALAAVAAAARRRADPRRGPGVQRAALPPGSAGRASSRPSPTAS